jgi:hypothetical protein
MHLAFQMGDFSSLLQGRTVGAELLGASTLGEHAWTVAHFNSASNTVKAGTKNRHAAICCQLDSHCIVLAAVVSVTSAIAAVFCMPNSHQQH